MFVQIIQAHVSDASRAIEVMEDWDRDLRPEAAGFLGGTAGITSDGTLFSMARFESESAAQANSDRPEQTEWWLELSDTLDSEPAFDETTDVETMRGGGSDDARFVQVIRGVTSNRKRLIEIDKSFEKLAGDARPDILGGFTAWVDDTAFVQIVYFTSEEAARQGESAEMPDEMKKLMGEYESLVSDVEYLDLVDPLLF